MTDNDIVSIIEELLEKIVDSSNKEETKLYGISLCISPILVLFY